MENNLLLSPFWTRIWAFLIDSIILGLFGFILGIIFKNYFITLGENAKIIGWVISMAYFSILNSKLNNGQTLGKKIMNIQVVDISGTATTLKTSLIRSFIFTFPFFLNGFKISGVSQFSAFMILQSIIIFVLGLGIIVFYIFNKETRQSIHDIIAKTYVVKIQRNTEISFMPKVTKLPFYITGGIFLIVIFFSVYTLNSKSEISKLIPVYEALEKQNNISNAGVTKNFPAITDRNGIKRFTYTVKIQVKRNLDLNNNPEANINTPELIQSVKTFIDSKAYETDNDILNVVVISGFDIGIAKQYDSFNFYKPISEWKGMLQY
ncbi:hypothetical protein CHRYSEOSP005_26160 [Chryseobacterium sp. Alg-005]|uniref:RDD family protein n=1 Tax=Chryseobacterium sp. Alg-005 TaxID=3159516 RepID=UPI00355584DF